MCIELIVVIYLPCVEVERGDFQNSFCSICVIWSFMIMMN